MDYKEKYEQALMVAKETYNTQPMYREWLEKMFPEFKESEDDKIRNHIRRAISVSLDYSYFDKETANNCLAWLEKQGVQKSIWHNEDEEPQRDSLILLIMQSGTPIVAKIIEPNHTFNHGERWAYIDDLLEKQDKQKPIEIISAEESLGIDSDTYNKIIDACIYGDDKIEPKFKVGDKIYLKPEYRMPDDDTPIANTVFEIRAIDDKHYRFDGSYIFIEDQDKYELVEQKLAWSEEEEHYIRQLESMVRERWALAEKAQDEDVIKNMSDLAFFLKTLNSNKKPTDEEMKTLLRTEYEKGKADAIVEMQMEWSEKDKDFMYGTLSNLTELKDRYGEGYCNVGKCIDWLKSLRPQSRWKPSDKHIRFLQAMVNDPNNASSESCQIVLKDILEKLKKLKEE